MREHLADGTLIRRSFYSAEHISMSERRIAYMKAGKKRAVSQSFETARFFYIFFSIQASRLSNDTCSVRTSFKRGTSTSLSVFS